MLVTVICGPFWSKARAKRCRMKPSWNSLLAPLPKCLEELASERVDLLASQETVRREGERCGRPREIVGLLVVVDLANHHPAGRRDLPVEPCHEVADRVLVALCVARAPFDTVLSQRCVEPVDRRLVDPDCVCAADAELSDERSARGPGRTVELTSQEEVELVLDDRAADRRAVLLDRELVLGNERVVGGEFLVAEGVERRTGERIGAVLGHGVHQRAGEPALGHVERRDHDLVFLDRLERDATATGLATEFAGFTQPEPVVLGGAVDLDRIEPIALTGRGQVATAPGVGGHLRRNPDEILELPIERREACHKGIRDGRLRAGAGRGEHRRVRQGHCHQLLDLYGLPGQRQVGADRLGERHLDLVHRAGRKADRRHRHAVAANLEATHEVCPVGTSGHRAVEAGFQVRDANHRVLDRAAGGIAHDTADRARGHALRHARGGQREERREDARHGECQTNKTSHHCSCVSWDGERCHGQKCRVQTRTAQATRWKQLREARGERREGGGSSGAGGSRFSLLASRLSLLASRLSLIQACVRTAATGSTPGPRPG